MVAGSFGKAGLFVDITSGALLGEGPGGHDVVQSPAKVSPESAAGPVVPEGILAWLIAVHSEYINKTPIDDSIEGFMYIGVVTDVAEEGNRVVHVYGQRGDVEVSEPDNRVGRFEIVLEEAEQAVEPGELVIELLGIGRNALGNVSIDDGDAVNIGYYETGGVFWVIFEAGLDVFDFAFGENGDAIIAFLAFEGVFVGGIFKGFVGEIDVLNLGFLEGEDVGLMLFEPIEDYRQAGTEGIDVEAGDFHRGPFLAQIADNRIFVL